MVRNSVVRYFNKTWIKCLQYTNCPTYAVSLLSGEFLVEIGHKNIMIKTYSFVAKKYTMFSFSKIKTEKELLKELTINCDKIARIIKEEKNKNESV